METTAAREGCGCGVVERRRGSFCVDRSSRRLRKPAWERFFLVLLVWKAVTVCNADLASPPKSAVVRKVQVMKAEENLDEVVDNVFSDRDDLQLLEMHDLHAVNSQKRHKKHHHKNHRHGKHHHGTKHRHHVERRSSIGNAGSLVSMVVHNAVPKNSSLKVVVRPGILNLTESPVDVYKYHKEVLDYGETIKEERLVLNLEDEYSVSNGQETYVGTVSDSINGVPWPAEIFLLSDVDKDNRLHCSLGVFKIRKETVQDYTWTFTYNALLPRAGDENKPTNLDVLLFNPEKYGIDYSLHRIAKNVALHDGQEAGLPYGGYEVKVVPHNSVRNVNQFKNAKSILPPIFVTISKETRRYLVLQGKVSSSDYEPELSTFPSLQVKDPPTPPLTKLFILNADFMTEAVTFELLTPNKTRVYLPYGASQSCHVDIRRGHEYKVVTGRDVVTSTINSNVPYKNGVCVIIPDRSRSGTLEAFHACWAENQISIAPDHSWIFTYHALLDYKDPVEVIIFDESALSSVHRHSLYSIADHLELGEAVPAIVEVGTYELKVVPHNTVYNTDDFKKAASLIKPITIKPQSQTRHYGAIQGRHLSDKAQHESVPPMANIKGRKVNKKCQCKSCVYYHPLNRKSLERYGERSIDLYGEVKEVHAKGQQEPIFSDTPVNSAAKKGGKRKERSRSACSSPINWILALSLVVCVLLL